MTDELETLYNIKVESLAKVSDKVTRVNTKEKMFILKKHNNDFLNPEFTRLSIAHVDYFLIPLKSVNGKFIEKIEDSYYSLTEYYDDEQAIIKDLRLKFYILSLASLHQNTTYFIKANDGFFDESFTYIENKIEQNIHTILVRMERIEHEEYHSPFEWYFYDCFNELIQGFTLGKKHLSELEELCKNSTSLHLSLTYQNYDLNHILIKKGKIISLDNLALAPSVYDFNDFILKTYKENMDYSYLFSQYATTHSLEEYEKHWLICLLMTKKIEFKQSDIDDFEFLYDYLKLINTIYDIEKIILLKPD